MYLSIDLLRILVAILKGYISMKKNTALGLIALFSFAANAGAYEAVASVPANSSYLFSTLEGTYTWTKNHGFRFAFIDDEDDSFEIHSGRDRSRWGGRLAVGYAKQLCCPFYVSGEIGWGYYGRTRHPLHVTGPLADDIEEVVDLGGLHIKTSQNGFDVLAGLIWNQDCWELFFKAGALIQNNHRNISVDFGELLIDSDLTGGLSVETNRTEVLPEIKLGGSWYFCDNWAITASWMHAFGTRPRIDLVLDIENPFGESSIHLRNPSLDVFTLGIQYRFC